MGYKVEVTIKATGKVISSRASTYQELSQIIQGSFYVSQAEWNKLKDGKNIIKHGKLLSLKISQ